jgi:multiple sugar transport system substrate-binding protein
MIFLKKFPFKFKIYIVFVLVFLGIASLYKFKLVEAARTMDENNENKGKTIVTVFLKSSSQADTRREQILRYNEENTDNIFVNLKIEGASYNNLLKTALATSDRPDIFEYGYSDLYKYDRIMDMKQFGLDIDKIGKENFIYYKKKPMGVKILGNNVKLIWNKEMLKGAGIDPESQPETFDELMDYGLKIKKAYPDVIPFEFPATTIGEIQISIGEMSVNKGSIYTTFWDYKTGKYNFNYAKDILDVYSKMYSLGLLDEEFADKNKSIVRRDFASKKAAMIISTFEDKNYFENILPLDFTMGISNLPKIDSKDSQNYYYTEDYSCLVVNSDLDNGTKDKAAIRKIYELFLDPQVNNQILATKKALPIFMENKVQENDVYKEYNNDTNFKNELFDPTPFISYEEKVTRQLLYEAIRGKQTVDIVIKKLNKNYSSYCKFMKDNYSFDFSEFKEK